MDCCNANEKSLIVTTINPISHSCPVHHGTKFYVHSNFIAVMQGKHHLRTQFLLKQNTNNTTCCIQLQSSIFFLPLGLDTSFHSQSILTLIVQKTVSKCLVHSQSNSKEP